MQRHESYKSSGIQWINTIPMHWDVQRAKWIFERRERPPRAEDGVVTAFRDGQVTLRSNRRTEGFTNAIQEHGYQGIRKGDLVIHAMDAFAGAIGVSDSDGKSTPVYAACVPRGEYPANNHYYAYMLRYMAYSGYIESLSKGIRERSTDFRFAEFRELPLPIPPQEEQDRIVTFLDQKTSEIEAAIAKKLRRIELLNEQKKILVETLVCRGLGTAVPTRNSGIDSVGNIPEHWSIKKLGHLANVVRGASPRPAGDPRYFSSEGGVSWVTVAEVTKDESLYLRETKESLTPIGARQSQEFRRGTVIFTNSGATLGVPKILDIDCCANDGVVALKRLSNEVNKEFLYYFLSTTTERLREEMKQGGGQPNLNTGIVKSIAVPLPPTQEQEEIVQCINLLLGKQQTLLRQTRTSIEQLQRLKDTLVADVVAGKLKV